MRIFKYVTFDRLDVLKNEMIRFIQPAALNDPWELKPYFEKLIGDETVEEEVFAPVDDKYIENVLIKELEKRWADFTPIEKRIQPLTLMKKTAMKNLKSNPEFIKQMRSEMLPYVEFINNQGVEMFVTELCERFGILSLTTKPNNKLMWAHYSANHTGFVIEFDPEHSFFTSRQTEADDLSGLHPMVYASQRPSLKDLKTLSEFQNSWEPLFFTKEVDWSYEEEWRVVNPLNEASKIIENTSANIHLFHLPATCIKGVVLGCQMAEEQRKIVIDFLRNDNRYKHVVLSEAMMSKISYDLDIRPLA